jgi:hypothetical protein
MFDFEDEDVPKRDPKSPRGMDDCKIVGREVALRSRGMNGNLTLLFERK